ncbi:MAG: bifunctional 3-(3-hydroxy-phenyl)propionate/3-hydroxycinnamic acid hydroxylase, partial [Chloroflexota bacterium]
VIIGLGPVGATLANFLGLSGWHVAVVEKEKEIFPIPRAVHVDDEAQRIWQAAGLIPYVRPAFGGYPPDRQYINARGHVYFQTELSKEKPFGFQTHMYFHQPTLEEGLRMGLDRFKTVTVLLGHEATHISNHSDHVSVSLKDEAGETVDITAKYLVGCDGARSFVRKSLDIKLLDLKFEQPWLVTDFYLKNGVTRDDLGLPYAHQQICDPAQPISFIPQGKKNHYRFEFMLKEGISKAEAEDEAFVETKLSSVVDTSKIDVVRGAVYTFHSLVARDWLQGRTLIAGDAAHQMPPFAGQGMCSGLRDAHNLAWKLDLVLSGLADLPLLATYEAERKPHVTRMTRGAMFLGNLVQTQSRARAWVRDLLFQTIFKIPAVFGRLSRFALRAPHLQTSLQGGEKPQLSGLYFIQPSVQDADGLSKKLDDLFGNNFIVLGYLDDQSQYFQQLPADFPIKYLTIGARADVDDIRGSLNGWFHQHDIDAVILRPDRYIFGAYSSTTIANAQFELLEQLSLKR